MSRRLVKIAKELNVGTTTIVDYLNNNGFDIENKPTAQVTDEMYTELLKEFQKSIAIKEKADQLIIGNRPQPKKDTPGVSTSSPLSGKATPSKFQSKTEPDVAAKTDEKPEETKTNKEEKEAEKPKERKSILQNTRLKILGKIDLESRKDSPKVEPPPPKSEPEPKSKTEETPPAKEEKKETPPAKESVPPKSAEKEPEVSEKEPEEDKGKTPPPSTEQPSPQPALSSDENQRASTEKEKPEKEQPVAEKEEKSTKQAPQKTDGGPKQDDDDVKETVTTTPTTDGAVKQGDGVVRAEAPELRGLKILGKIDTAKFNRPKKKKKEKSADKAKKGKTVEDARSKDKKGPGEAESTDAAGKKKRRRKRRKVKVEGETLRGENRKRGDRDSRDSKTREEITEVSQREIEEKIKATMARISGGGKKKRQKMRRDNRERLRERQELREQEQENEKLQLTEFVSVQELANLMDVGVTDVIMTCMNLGVIVSINQRLDAEIIELVAEEYGHEVEFISAEEHTEEEEEIVDDPEDLLPRAPIVTVMGHVDHGKTSLLDHIRKAKVAEGEAGGITQHIGAYEVKVGEESKRITFLDTPGHEAFTAMRARGAKVTDIAVIIIAADDNIMPQTREAISHSQAAGVPMVFAINKIDKPGADATRIKQELAGMNFLVEEWGGNYQSQDISAKTGQGIDELLEKILLEAELLELKANPDRGAVGAVIEASLDKGRGYVTKVLIQTGTLHIGDPIVAGEHSGKVKAMFNERGKRVKQAGPSKPVLVLGLDGAPQAGERFKEVDSEQEARQIASKRAQISREQANRATKRISLDEIGRRLALGSFKELNLIVKGDVDGSIEALSDSLIKLSIESVQVNVIHKAVGQIIESDVLLASASDAIIIGFQVRPSLSARKLAEKEGVQIKTYSIIYKAIEEIKMAIEGMLEPTREEVIVGQVEVREVYKISKIGTVAGCYVQEGKLTRNTNIRLIRNGIVVFPTKEGAHGEIASLKRFKDDVKEVKSGLECGISIKNFNDIKVGDVIEGYEIVEVKQRIS
jgi:translation initiation factor IF-2